MRWRLIFTVALALGLPAQPVAAGQKRTFAEAAETVINAVKQGRDLTELQMFHPNYTHDAEAVSRLAGCSHQLLTGSSQYVLRIDWTCPDTNNDVFTNLYISDGTISKFEFLPTIRHMKPTEAAIALGAMDSPGSINRQFVKAVRTGSDVTLGGIIPVSDEMATKLAAMKGWTAQRSTTAEDGGIKQFWVKRANSQGDAAATTIHFDEEGRPIGIWLSEFQILMMSVN